MQSKQRMQLLTIDYCCWLNREKIGNIVIGSATCTSTKEMETQTSTYERRNSICAWGPTALLPVFQLLGTDYEKKEASSYFMPENDNFDLFTKINFNYKNAVASVKVGKGVKLREI